MCFFIDRRATCPRKRVVYKIVRKEGSGYLRSQFQGRYYQPGVHRRSNGSTTLGCQANHGIYVYLELKEAKAQITNYPWRPWRRNDVIMRCEVAPMDWLHTSTCGKIATYHRITIPEEQPYIEWY